MRNTFALVSLLALGACGGDDAPEQTLDGGARDVVDGGSADGGATDGGRADGGVIEDATDSGEADAGPCAETIRLLDYSLSPSMFELASGASVICAVNDGATPHDLVVRTAAKMEIGRTPVLQPGQTARLSVTLTVGSYEVYCSVAGHEALGMKGPLTVR